MNEDQKAGCGIVIILGVLIAGSVALHFWNKPVRETEQLLESIARQRDAITNADGEYVRDTKTSALDAWGNPVRITYSSDGDNPALEIVTARSAGRDGKMDTADDLYESCHNFIPQNLAHEVGEGFTEGVADGIIDTAREVRDALTGE